MYATKTELNNVKTAMEAMELAGMNFIPEKLPIMTGTGIDCPEHCAIVRSDNKRVLSIMGKDYNPIAPYESFAIVDTLLSQIDGAKYTKLYSIDGGKRIVMEAEAPGEIRTGTGKTDILKKRIRFTDSYDGSTKFVASFGLWRPLCANMALWEAKEVKAFAIRHTRNAAERVRQAMLIWAGAEDAFKAWEKNVQYLANKIVGREQVEKFLNEIIGKIDNETSTRKENQWNEIENLIYHGRGNEGKTAWDLYNGVTEYYDHHTNIDNEEKRIASSMFGTGASQKTKAMNLAIAI